MNSQLLRRVQSHHGLRSAWHVVQENARTSTSPEVRAETAKFAENSETGIRSISGRLQHKTFRFQKSRGVEIKKKSGGRRPLVVAPVESRIVQRTILDALVGLDGLKPYVFTDYSFGGVPKVKGKKRSAVPAAIEAVLKSIEDGATHIMFADISSFFTKIPKPHVMGIVSQAANDVEFMELLERAIAVELSNMAQLRDVSLFPIYEIGVAQGNALSPLLGNIVLYDFDQAMNEGDCRCIRYIDDFIILAPSGKAARSRFRKAQRLLQKLNMKLSPDKSSKRAIGVHEPFTFLGIELSNGRIRPSKESRERMLGKVRHELEKSEAAFNAVRSGEVLDARLSFLATLKRVDGILQGWGKHYRFCNDVESMNNLDDKLENLIGHYLGHYGDTRDRISDGRRRDLFGIQQLKSIESDPLIWPKSPSTERMGINYGMTDYILPGISTANESPSN